MLAQLVSMQLASVKNCFDTKIWHSLPAKISGIMDIIATLSSSSPVQSTSVSTSMSPSETALHRAYADIKTSLDVDLVLPYLLQRYLLSQAQVESLQLHGKSHTMKIYNLTMWLSQKGPNFLDLFIQCLIDSSEGKKDHRHHILAEKLRAERAAAESGEHWESLEQGYGT